MGGRLRLVTDALIDELELSWNIKAHTRNIYEAFLLGDSDFRAYYTARNQAWFDTHVGGLAVAVPPEPSDLPRPAASCRAPAGAGTTAADRTGDP